MSTRTGLTPLFKAFKNALVGVQKSMQKQHIAQLQQYIDGDGKAKCLTVKVPSIGTEEDWRELEVPLIVLSPPSSLKIKRMNVKFKARIGGMSDHDDCEDGECELQIHMGGLFNRSTEAKIEIEFEGTEPPEGFMKINDELVKAIH